MKGQGAPEDLSDLNVARSNISSIQEDEVLPSVMMNDRLGGVPREQKMLKGYLSRVIYHQLY